MKKHDYVNFCRAIEFFSFNFIYKLLHCETIKNKRPRINNYIKGLI